MAICRLFSDSFGLHYRKHLDRFETERFRVHIWNRVDVGQWRSFFSRSLKNFQWRLRQPLDAVVGHQTDRIIGFPLKQTEIVSYVFLYAVQEAWNSEKGEALCHCFKISGFTSTMRKVTGIFIANWEPYTLEMNKSKKWWNNRKIIILISTQSGHYESPAVHLMVERCVQVDA